MMSDWKCCTIVPSLQIHRVCLELERKTAGCTAPSPPLVLRFLGFHLPHPRRPCAISRVNTLNAPKERPGVPLGSPVTILGKYRRCNSLGMILPARCCVEVQVPTTPAALPTAPSCTPSNLNSSRHQCEQKPQMAVTDIQVMFAYRDTCIIGSSR